MFPNKKKGSGQKRVIRKSSQKQVGNKGKSYEEHATDNPGNSRLNEPRDKAVLL